eukprot:symbB.v1.2.002385.t1/scaffold125.1/size314497/1
MQKDRTSVLKATGFAQFAGASEEKDRMLSMNVNRQYDITSIECAEVHVELPTCHYFRSGRCSKGASCKFSHQLCQGDESPSLRMEKLRLQVEYYLSDENLTTDSFFQA